MVGLAMRNREAPVGEKGIERGKNRGIFWGMYDPLVPVCDSDIVISSTVQYPKDIGEITPSQGVTLTGETKAGKAGNEFTLVGLSVRLENGQ